jgi:hypothetical protein
LAGINGVMSGTSRLVAGVLLDYSRYSFLMGGNALLLMVSCSSAYFVYDISFTGAVVLIWITYFLACSHFTTVIVEVLMVQVVDIFSN